MAPSAESRLPTFKLYIIKQIENFCLTVEMVSLVVIVIQLNIRSQLLGTRVINRKKLLYGVGYGTFKFRSGKKKDVTSMKVLGA